MFDWKINKNSSMQILRNLFIGLLYITVLAGFISVQKDEPGKQTVSAKAYGHVIPVLVGAEHNPILHINISVPADGRKFTVTKLNGSVYPLKDIESIDVFVTGAEPFSANNKIASFKPSAEQFSIPVELEMKRGVQFVWFSVRLKKGSSIGQKVLVKCNSIEGANGEKVTVKQDAQAGRHYVGSVVRKAGEDGVHTYRIPGIIQTDKGTLISVYDIRYNNSADLPGNIDVGLSRSIDSGRTWQPMKKIMDMGEPHANNGVGDPAVLFDPVTKKIWVAALWSKGNRSIAGSLPGLSPDTTGQFVLVSSADDGLSWSEPVSITVQVKDPIWHLFFNGPGSGIAMEDGKLVFAAQYWDEKKIPHSTIIYSEDHGKTWKGNIAGPKSNTTESQVVETRPGTIMLNMRDNRGGYRSVATTNDLGKTWTEHTTSFQSLPDPVCMASIIKMPALVSKNIKDIIFFSNTATSSGRYNMTIKASADLGESWKSNHQVLVDERPCYGYSSLVRIDDKHVGILYEGIRDLYFVKVPVADIIQ